MRSLHFCRGFDFHLYINSGYIVHNELEGQDLSQSCYRNIDHVISGGYIELVAIMNIIDRALYT